MTHEEWLTCPTCNGSGEGMFEGTRCSSCGGTGTEKILVEDEEDKSKDDDDDVE